MLPLLTESSPGLMSFPRALQSSAFRRPRLLQACESVRVWEGELSLRGIVRESGGFTHFLDPGEDLPYVLLHLGCIFSFPLVTIACVQMDLLKDR